MQTTWCAVMHTDSPVLTMQPLSPLAQPLDPARSADCVACGASPTLTRSSLPDYDYRAFTGQRSNDKPAPPLRLLDPVDRLSPAELKQWCVGLATLLREGYGRCP